MKKTIGVVLAFALASSGCAFTWGASQLGTGKPPMDENARSESVPMPGVLESLNVELFYAGRPVVRQYSSASSAQPAGPPAPPTPLDTEFVVGCQVVQTGQEKVYRAATQYGKRWKYSTAIMFVLEGALAAAYILSDESKAHQKIGGYLLAADAVGTGALFFMPSRDVYENSIKPTTTPVRSDCPEGLSIELAGRQVAVAANGKIGAFGATLVKEHMENSNTPIRVVLGQNSADIFLTGSERCRWARRTQHPNPMQMCNQSGGTLTRTSASVTLAVPLGSLIGPAATSAE